MIELSAALKSGVAKTLSDMLRAQETAPTGVVGFSTIKISFTKPEKGTFKVLKQEDLPSAGLKEDQEIYVYQEA